ncbi:MAG TPA: hypothetical protein VLG47_04135 [Candidatus Saccharimonadales bacterium]|nr:hypothetical protein [Candidatus Saccharimonadales bacterium]
MASEYNNDPWVKDMYPLSRVGVVVNQGYDPRLPDTLNNISVYYDPKVLDALGRDAIQLLNQDYPDCPADFTIRSGHYLTQFKVSSEGGRAQAPAIEMN